MFRFLIALTWLITSIPILGSSTSIEADLLIVGGNESACAAAVQAARLGVKQIVLVNDIDWLGGQFSAQGVGCPDEWTTINGKRANFPRSGLYAEVIAKIRAHNSATYGLASPGNSFCGTETIEPAAAERIFEELLAPYTEKGTGQIRVLRGWQPTRVDVESKVVRGVDFEKPSGDPERLSVKARITVDPSEWGDVIRLSGARYGAGPDLRSRFGEPSAPEKFDEAGVQEMNPVSWCVVLREAGKSSIIPKPPTYNPESFKELDKTPPWVDSDMSGGIYSMTGWSIYTHRRLVDRWHNGFAPGTDATFLNWPVQDYPLCQLPQRVIDALEAIEPGASKKNIVDMTPAQRNVVFDDVKQHTLGMLYHLQTAVHDRVGDFPQSFRYMKLTDEFGTPDHLPPLPYVREGLRLEALYMLHEQDIRAATREPKWAKLMVPDAVFGFQFNIDFHPTRRKFLNGDRSAAWHYVHTDSRGWHTDTDRAMFPLRGLVPIELDGLLGCSKNIGVSSVVQSALRLHGQMMHVGQATATVAWMALRDGIQPRAIAADPKRVSEIQLRLVRGNGGPGVLLWPWQDLGPDDLHFEAANMLAVRGIWPADSDSVFFQPQRTVTRRELARVLSRFCEAIPLKREGTPGPTPEFKDIPTDDPDRSAIEKMLSLGDFGPQNEVFSPDAATNWGTLHRWLRVLGYSPDASLDAKTNTALPLTRSECVRHLWRIAKDH